MTKRPNSVRRPFVILFLLACGLVESSWAVQQSPVVPHDDPAIEREAQNIYQAISNPTINLATISSATVKYVSISTVSIGSATVTNLVGLNGSADACAGCVGEIISATKVRTSETQITSGVGATIVSINLTPGVWVLFGYGAFDQGIATSWTLNETSISTTNNTLSGSATIGVPDSTGQVRSTWNQPAQVPTADRVYAPLMSFVRTSASATYYLVAKATFSADLGYTYGSLWGIRL